MPNILKRLLKSDAVTYVFPSVEDQAADERAKSAPAPAIEDGGEPESRDQGLKERDPEEEKLHFADIQARAILESAERDAEEIRERARQEMRQELEDARESARQEGFAQGFASGMAQASQEARLQREQQAAELAGDVKKFLEDAAREKAELLDSCREELKTLAVSIAEKVIRISLKGSDDILLRMVDAATDTHKRCEWAHIYIADCDVRGRAQTIPELTAALSRLSERVKVIPMADDESGTCIVELPDVILDASVSTQLENIREVLDGASLDKD